MCARRDATLKPTVTRVARGAPAPRRWQVMVNFVTFQVAWFAVMCLAAREHGWWAFSVAAAQAALHLAVVRPERATVLLLLGVTLGGTAADQFLGWSGVLEYRGSAVCVGFVPIWIVGSWLSFATTLNASLAWLRGRWLLAAGFGALGGPLAYVGASRLGAVTFAEGRLVEAHVILAVEWAVVAPLACAYAMWVSPLRDSDASAT